MTASSWEAKELHVLAVRVLHSRKLPSLAIAVSALCLLAGSPAHADTEIVAVPTNWRLENYTGSSQIVTYNTGSTCASGALRFPATATAEDHNRYFSLILAAKMNGRAVGLFYETASGNCQITSFYIQQ